MPTTLVSIAGAAFGYDRRRKKSAPRPPGHRADEPEPQRQYAGEHGGASWTIEIGSTAPEDADESPSVPGLRWGHRVSFVVAACALAGILWMFWPSEDAAIAAETAPGGAAARSIEVISSARDLESQDPDRGPPTGLAGARGRPSPARGGLGDEPSAPSEALKRPKSQPAPRKASARRADRRRYKQAEDIDPQRKAARVEAGAALSKAAFASLRRGKNRHALERASRALVLDPYNAESWFVLGGARQALHDEVGAQEAYRRCASLGEAGYAKECRRLLK